MARRCSSASSRESASPTRRATRCASSTGCARRARPPRSPCTKCSTRCPTKPAPALSAFGDDHTVRAPIGSGTIEAGTPQVEIAVEAGQMNVLDPDLSPKKREEVQKRMMGPEVLDVARFKEIRFKSTRVEAKGT